MVDIEEIRWGLTSISSVGVSIKINNSIIWIILLLQFLIVISVSVGKLIGVEVSHLTQGHSLGKVSVVTESWVCFISWNGDMSSWSDMVSVEEVLWDSATVTSVGVTVIVNDKIVWIVFLLELFIVRFVSVGKFVGVWFSSELTESTVSHDLMFISWDSNMGTWHDMVFVPEWREVSGGGVRTGISSGLLVLVSADIVVDIITSSSLGQGRVSHNLMFISWDCNMGSWHDVVFIPEWREVS
jgi:hypothetical protein